MNEQMKQLFNECIENVQHNGDFGSIAYTVYCGDCIEFDFFDHMIQLMCDSGDTKIKVSYFNRPTLKVDYGRIFDFNIELVGTITYIKHTILILFKYRELTYRLIYDFNKHTMLVQLLDDEYGMVFDFDDDYTRNFSTIYNNVVYMYDSNVECIKNYRNS